MENKKSGLRETLSSFGLIPIIGSIAVLFLYLFLIFQGVKFAGNLFFGANNISPTPPPTIIPTQPPILSPTPPVTLGDSATKEECEQLGGRWGQWGLLPQEYCQIPSQDAGKPCTDGSQCSYGLCMSREQNTKGTCSTYRQEFGCYSTIVNNQPGPAICVD